MVNPVLFKERAFAIGLLVQFCFWMGVASFFLVLAVYLQLGRSLTALQAGATFMAVGAGYLIISFLAPRLVARLGRQIISIGALVMAVGLGLLAVSVHSHHPSIAWLTPGLFIEGAGMGLALSPLISVVLSRVLPEYAGTTSGILATTQQLGNAVGVAAVGAIFYREIGASGNYGNAFRQATITLAVLSLLVVGLVQLLPRRQGEL